MGRKGGQDRLLPCWSWSWPWPLSVVFTMYLPCPCHVPLAHESNKVTEGSHPFPQLGSKLSQSDLRWSSVFHSSENVGVPLAVDERKRREREIGLCYPRSKAGYSDPLSRTHAVLAPVLKAESIVKHPALYRRYRHQIRN